MKKILSMGLAVTMAMAAMPAAYASNVYDSSDPHSGNPGTQVEYVATTQSAYTITVPAKMTPKLGEAVTGTVTLAGSWASNETVKVTADEKVVLTNSINPLDTHELAVTLPVMEYAGDNTEAKTYTGTVTLAEMPAAALFGEWTGKFNYNVEFDDGQPALIDINLLRITDGTEYPAPAQAEEGMTWRQWTRSSYAIGMSTVLPADEYVDHEYVAGITGVICSADTLQPIHPDDVIAPGTYRLILLKNLT